MFNYEATRSDYNKTDFDNAKSVYDKALIEYTNLTGITFNMTDETDTLSMKLKHQRKRDYFLNFLAVRKIIINYILQYKQDGLVMLSTIESINSVINNFIWGLPAMICIIGVGIVLSVRTGFIQI